MKPFILFISILMLGEVKNSDVSSWVIQPHSSIQFKISGPLGTTVNGNLAISSSKILFDTSSLSNSSFTIAVSALSINTDNKKRDEHLKKQDFFGVEQFPLIHFQTTSIQKTAEGKYIAKGNLTIKSVTKTVSIGFRFQEHGVDANFQGDFIINRLDYGIGGKSILIGNEVFITISVVARKG